MLQFANFLDIILPRIYKHLTCQTGNKDKPKLFYSYVRNKQKVKRVIPQLNTGARIMTSSDEEIAQEL